MMKSSEGMDMFGKLVAGGDAFMTTMRGVAESAALNAADTFPFTLDKPSGMVPQAVPYVLSRADELTPSFGLNGYAL